MEGAGIADFSWVLLFAAAAGVLSVRFRLPPVAGLLIAGMVIGPNILHLVDLPTINTFADIGAILLLFMIGVEFSVAKLLSTGLRAVFSSMLLVLISFLIMHQLAILLGFRALDSLYIASMFSMSSTAIMMKLLEQKRLLERQEVPVLVTMLIVEDIIAVFMLTFFSNLEAGGYAAEGILGSVLVSLGVLAFTYFVLLSLLRKFSDVFLRYQAEDTTIMFAFGLGIGMSALASVLGLTPSIGAFLAGSIIAGLPNGRDLEAAMRPFSLVFSSFFFLSVGMLIDPGSMAATAGQTAILIGAFMVMVFLATTFTYYLITASGRSSVFAGLAMLPLGEFSLLIAKEGAAVQGINLVGMAAVGVLVSSLVCAATLRKSEILYSWLRRSTPPWMLETLSNASAYFRNVISSFEPEGYFHKLFMSELKVIVQDVVYLIMVAAILWLVRGHLQFDVSFAGMSAGAYTVALVVAAVISSVSIVRVLMSARKLFDALSSIFSRTTPGASKGTIVRNLAVSAMFFILSTNTDVFVEYLLLPTIFNWLSPVFALLSVFFLWSAIRAASFSFFLGGMHPLSVLQKKVSASMEDIIIVGQPSQPHYAPERRQKKRFIFMR